MLEGAGAISNSGFSEADRDLEDYFDKGQMEEYINVRDSDRSLHILPLSNTKYNSGDSQYEEDDF